MAAKIWRAVSRPKPLFVLSVLYYTIHQIVSSNDRTCHLSQCPTCKNSDIETCLFSSAVDLGLAGKDVNFGHGLVQADDAYLCLRDQVQCCTEVASPTLTPPSSPPAASYTELAAPTGSTEVTSYSYVKREDMKQVCLNHVICVQNLFQKLNSPF